MSKRTKSSTSFARQILYLLVIIALSLIAVRLGFDPEEFGLPDILGTGDDNKDTVSEVPPASGEWYEIYFTQTINSDEESAHHGSAVEQALIRRIDGAQQTIDAALFELNAPDMTAALVRALERGVKMRLVLDDEHALEDPESTAQEVIDAGAEYRSDERSALMHDKYFIIDSTYVWTGSTNVTRNGFYNNNNNGILIQSPALVENFQADFEEMFTDGAFSNRDDTRAVPSRVIDIGGTQVETYFSPDDRDEVEARIIELVSGAESSIRVMTFSYTVDTIGAAMIAQLNAGVVVEGVFETTGSLQGQMPVLACAGATVRQDGNPNILHHKVIIIDEKIVLSGSFNFSNSAMRDNSENLLIIHNPDIAAAYTAEFRARFAEGREIPAEDLSC